MNLANRAVRLSLGAVLLGGLSTGLLFARSAPSRSAIVFVLDVKSPLADNEVADWRRILGQYAGDGLSGCRVILLASDEGTLMTDGSSAGAWIDAETCRADPVGYGEIVGSVDDAARLAARSFDERALTDRVADAIFGVRRRIAWVVSDPTGWRARTVHSESLGRSAMAAEAANDVLHAPWDRDVSAVLEIEIDPELAPEYSRAGAIRLRVTTGARRDLPESFAGRASCVIDASEDPASGFRTSPREQELAFRRDPDGVFVAEDLRMDAFAAPDGSPAFLERGFHHLECDLAADLGNRRVRASARRFWRVGTDDYLIVQGHGERFSLRAGSLDPTAVDRNIWERLPTRSVSALRYRGVVSEDDACAGASCALDLTESAAAARRPEALVLHDVSEAALSRMCPSLAKWVDDGMQLIVSGVPDARDLDCAVLPVRARRVGGRDAILDRRPEVHFIFDDSRIGKLRFPRTPAGQGFVPATTYGTPADVEDGRAVQARVAAALCARLRTLDARVRCAGSPSGGAPGSASEWMPIISHDSPQGADALREGELVTASDPLSRLRRAAEEAANTSRSGVRIERTFVLFTYGVAPRDRGAADSIVERIARGGARVYVVSLASPYQPALARAGAELAPSIDEARESVARSGGEEALPFSRDALRARVRRLEVNLASPAAGADRAVEAIARDLVGARGSRSGAFAIRAARAEALRFGRAVDPRLDAEWGDAFAAPLRIQSLELLGETAAFVPVLAASWHAAPTEPHDVTIGFAGGYGQGSVLALGYSIFESSLEVSAVLPPSPECCDPDDVVMQPAPPTRDLLPLTDRWGPRLVMEALARHERLDPGARLIPRVRAVTQLKTDGRIAFDVIQRIRAGDPIEPLSLVRCMNPNPLAACQLDRLLDPESVRLVGFSARGQSARYDIAPSALRRLCARGPGACVTALVRSKAVEADARAAGGNQIVLPPLNREVASALPDLRAVAALGAAAVYSGGGVSTESEVLPVPPVRLRSLWLSSLLLLLALALGAAAWRRWRARGAIATEADEVARRLVEMATSGSVREAGESLGRARTITAGAIAGVRTIEPGDRLASAEPADLLRMSHREPALPRVRTRFEDSAKDLVIAVHAGASMRVPAGRPAAPKLALGGNIAELLAAAAIQNRSTPRIELASVFPGTPLLRHDAPGSEIATAAAAAQASRRRRAIVDCDSCIYVSDFLEDDLDVLQKEIAAFEENGGRFGAVLVRARPETAILGHAWSASLPLATDREPLSPEDLERAYAEWARSVSRALSSTDGGVLVVHDAMSAVALAAALRDSRLMELLR